MNPASWLWDELHDSFDTDEGYYPEVWVNYLDPAGVAAGYALLRSRAAYFVNDSGKFCPDNDEVERHVDSVPNAAALVVSGEAESFYVILGGIQSQTVAIPNLGVFVFPHQLSVDYEMGPAWGPGQLEAFFGLLADLLALDPGASLSLEDWVAADAVECFHNAWRRWLSEYPVRGPAVGDPSRAD